MTMTPEEKAVVQAAIGASRTLGGMFDISPLGKAVSALISACPKCNAGGHVCPGDGNPIGHGDSDCGEHDDAVTKPSEERAHLTYQLREIAQATMQEWMRIVDLEDMAGIQFQARANWQDHQGSMVLGEHRGGEEYGAFQVTVSVTDLGPLPPIGPEDDGALRAELEERRVGFCMECVEPGEDPIVWCDCRSDEPPCRVPCKQNAHDPKACPARPDREADRVPLVTDEPTWIARTMADVRPGDTIRPAGMDVPGMRVTARCWPVAESERKQTTRDRGSWHVIEGQDGHWSDHVIQPGECCVHLDGAGHRLVKPTFGVEILLSPSEVAAIELLGWDNRERMVADA